MVSTFQNKNLNKLLDMVWDLYCIRYIDKIYYYPYRDEEEERLKKFFEILKVFEAKDNRFPKVTPLFLLKLKP